MGLWASPGVLPSAVGFSVLRQANGIEMSAAMNADGMAF